jgi:hypothetical protein
MIDFNRKLKPHTKRSNSSREESQSCAAKEDRQVFAKLSKLVLWTAVEGGGSSVNRKVAVEDSLKNYFLVER